MKTNGVQMEMDQVRDWLIRQHDEIARLHKNIRLGEEWLCTYIKFIQVIPKPTARILYQQGYKQGKNHPTGKPCSTDKNYLKGFKAGKHAAKPTTKK